MFADNLEAHGVEEVEVRGIVLRGELPVTARMRVDLEDRQIVCSRLGEQRLEAARRPGDAVRRPQAFVRRDFNNPVNDEDAAALDHGAAAQTDGDRFRSEEHTSELQSLMRISYAVFCLKKKNKTNE